MRQSDHDPSRPRDQFAPNPSVRRLTLREREVALLIADGLKNAVIAGRLGLSPGTVRNYAQHIMRRLNLGSREEIATWVTARRTPGSPEARLRRAGVDLPT
jgi:DNA-binding NarL/FixJ family response regulator